MTTIGFIGLGNMGGPMAANLVKAGHKVQGFDLSDAALDLGRSNGVEIARTATDAVSGAELVVTMLPAGRHVAAAYTGEGGLLSVAEPGTVFVDSSTIDVSTARSVHASAQDAGMLMVDAPVSGGVGGAAAGTLTFMAGGAADAFEKARPFLDIMGQKIVHCGDAGAGQAAKICNNMILGISMIAACEGFALAEKLGLDKQALFDVASTSSGQCWSINTYCPVPGPVPTSPANRDYEPGFAATLMLKDLKLSQDAAQGAGASTPLGAHATQLYSLFDAAGQGGTDFSGIIRFLRGDLTG